MHRFDEEPVSRWRRQSRPGCCQQRMISLRKYSLAICLAELLAIALLLVYLFTQAPPAAPSTRLAHEPGNVTKLYRTYSAGAKSSRFLVGLVSGCNQRKHDLPLAIKCHAKWWPSLDCMLLREPDALADAHADPDSGRALPALVVVTSMAGERLVERLQSLKRVDCGAGKSAQCRFATRAKLIPAERGQRIIGWGGALTDSSINNMLALTVNATRSLLNEYFDDLAFNLVRVTIGGSDFSARFYTNSDEKPLNFGVDTEQDTFELREEDILYKIPMLKLIQSEAEREPHRRRPIKLFASMWSPPVWMKTNSFWNGGQLKGRISDEPEPSESERYFRALAKLKADFVRAYQNQSVRFWGLTVMNEPVFAVQPFIDFNTMVFPARDYANYVAKYLGPTLRDDPQLRHLKLMAHDDNRRYLANFTAPMLRQTRVRQFVDGVSVHGYVDEDYQQMDEIYRAHNNRLDPDFFVLPTELSSGHLPFMEKALVGNWHRGMHYALDIVRSLQHSAAGWVDWNMALDLEGGPGWLRGRLDAPVIVDKAADAYYKSPMFYVLGQFSRYIPPDSWRVRTEMLNDNFDGHFEVVSFEVPRGAIRGPRTRRFVTVVVNNNPYPVELQLELPDQRTYAADCAANSVTTILYCNHTTLAC